MGRCRDGWWNYCDFTVISLSVSLQFIDLPSQHLKNVQVYFHVNRRSAETDTDLTSRHKPDAVSGCCVERQKLETGGSLAL